VAWIRFFAAGGGSPTRTTSANTIPPNERGGPGPRLARRALAGLRDGEQLVEAGIGGHPGFVEHDEVGESQGFESATSTSCVAR
jgi:hypothetical protein